MTHPNGPLRIGIGGPVGAGKTTLAEQLCRALAHRCSMAVITNDIYTREDADYLTRAQVLPADRFPRRESGRRARPARGSDNRHPRGCRCHW